MHRQWHLERRKFGARRIDQCHSHFFRSVTRLFWADERARTLKLKLGRVAPLAFNALLLDPPTLPFHPRLVLLVPASRALVAIAIMPSQPAVKPANGKGTLLSFFKKVEAAPGGASQPPGAPASTAPSAASSTAKKQTASSSTSYTKKGSVPSPPSTVSGGSVSPVASSSKQSPSSRLGTNASNSAVAQSKAAVKTATTPKAAPRGEPTPPASSPLSATMDEDDDDEEDLMPTTSRRVSGDRAGCMRMKDLS